MIRFTAGIVMILAWWLGWVSGVLGIVLGLVGIVLFLTGVVGYCPLYAALGIKTKHT